MKNPIQKLCFVSAIVLIVFLITNRSTPNRSPTINLESSPSKHANTPLACRVMLSDRLKRFAVSHDRMMRTSPRAAADAAWMALNKLASSQAHVEYATARGERKRVLLTKASLVDAMASQGYSVFEHIALEHKWHPNAFETSFLFGDNTVVTVDTDSCEIKEVSFAYNGDVSPVHADIAVKAEHYDCSNFAPKGEYRIRGTENGILCYKMEHRCPTCKGKNYPPADCPCGAHCMSCTATDLHYCPVQRSSCGISNEFTKRMHTQATVMRDIYLTTNPVLQAFKMGGGKLSAGLSVLQYIFLGMGGESQLPSVAAMYNKLKDEMKTEFQRTELCVNEQIQYGERNDVQVKLETLKGMTAVALQHATDSMESVQARILNWAQASGICMGLGTEFQISASHPDWARSTINLLYSYALDSLQTCNTVNIGWTTDLLKLAQLQSQPAPTEEIAMVNARVKDYTLAIYDFSSRARTFLNSYYHQLRVCGFGWRARRSARSVLAVVSQYEENIFSFASAIDSTLKPTKELCTRVSGVNAWGNDLRNYADTTIETCEKDCMNDAMCGCYMFDSTGGSDPTKGHCYLKSRCEELRDCGSCTTGSCVDADLCTRFRSSNLPGNDLKHESGLHSVAQCEKACFNDAGCKAFTSNPRTGDCWLKHTYAEGDLTHGSDLVSGECQRKLKFTGHGQDTPIPVCFRLLGMAFQEQNLIDFSHVGRIDKCQAKCTARADCKCVVYVPLFNGGTCALKSNCETLSVNVGMIAMDCSSLPA